MEFLFQRKFNADHAQIFLKDYMEKVHGMRDKSKQLKDTSQYASIGENVKKLIGTAFPHSSIEVHFFGSRIIGLGTDESDLDIFVDIDGKFFSTYTPGNENDNRFHKVASALENSREWRVTKRVLRTRVPVINCIYNSTKWNCKLSLIHSEYISSIYTSPGDVSMVNGLSTCNSKLLAHLFDIQPEAVSFYHFIRMWMKAQGFNDLKGYTITLLVLFYLQSKKLMPTVEVVQRSLPSTTIMGTINNIESLQKHNFHYY